LESWTTCGASPRLASDLLNTFFALRDPNSCRGMDDLGDFGLSGFSGVGMLAGTIGRLERFAGIEQDFSSTLYL